MISQDNRPLIWFWNEVSITTGKQGTNYFPFDEIFRSHLKEDHEWVILALDQCLCRLQLLRHEVFPSYTLFFLYYFLRKKTINKSFHICNKVSTTHGC